MVLCVETFVERTLPSLLDLIEYNSSDAQMQASGGQLLGRSVPSPSTATVASTAENTASPMQYANSPRSGTNMINAPSSQQQTLQQQHQLQQQRKMMQLPTQQQQQQLLAQQQFRQSAMQGLAQVFIMLLPKIIVSGILKYSVSSLWFSVDFVLVSCCIFIY